MVKKRRKKHSKRTIFLFIIALSFMFMGLVALWTTTFKVPDLETFNRRKVAQSTKIYDRTGEILLYDLFTDTKRTIVPINEISRNIKNATVAIEDAEFYEHIGIKPTSIIRAVLVNIGTLGFEQGGSTITQQVVKNSLLTQNKKISRKLKEWVLALRLEQIMSKEEILELYLNEAPYGGSIYGIEEASQAFFGKSSKDISLSESAYLAALPQAPTYYSPYGNNKENLEKRKNLVLKRMLENKFINENEYKNALEEKIDFLPRSDTGIRSPHFVLYVIEYLEKKYGRDFIENGGLKVTTTLDYDLEIKAEKIVNRFAKENEEKFNAENGSILAMDPKTGQILVMVGSRDYFDKDIDGNFNITTAERQPGSAFKPFVYATAFKKGYTPETVVFDLETEFSTQCDIEGKPLSQDAVCYMPGNYDNIFRGPVTLRNALAQSINIPAIKTLYLAGLSDSLKTAKDMGISTLTNSARYGLTLVLGGGEVSLLDITSAYGVFANGGIKLPHTSILKIETKDGNIIEKFEPKPVRVLNENVAALVSDILSDEEARVPAFGSRSYLYFSGRDVAAKTGTTNDYRDAWIIGYTPNLSVGAWAGNNDNSSMEKKVAGFIVAPMWNEFMREALKKTPSENFRPSLSNNGNNLKPVLNGEWRGSENYFIDSISGKLATENTPEETKKEKVITQVHSILYWLNKKDPNGPIPNEPELDSQFYHWEAPVLKWASSNGIVNEDNDIIPSSYDNIHIEANKPTIKINGLKEGQQIGNEKVWFSVQTSGVFPIKKVDIFANNKLIGSSNKSPFNFSFIPYDISSVGEIKIKAVVYDSVFNKNEDEKTLFLLN